MACRNLTEALLEDVIEIAWMFDRLMKSGEIKSWDDIIDEFDGSNGVKAEFKKIAIEFEKKYPFETVWEDTERNYIEEIEKFSKEKLIEVFGRETGKKKYYKITTSMIFEKTVLVDVNAVKDVNEAIDFVDDAVEVGSIDLLNEVEAECVTKPAEDTDNGICEKTDKEASIYTILCERA